MKYRGCHITTDINDSYLGSGTFFCESLKKIRKRELQKRNIIHL
jgi:hypothetical protein